MNEKWISDIQQKMADYRQPAPEVSWAAVDKALAAGKPMVAMPRQYWFRGIAAAVVLVIVAGIGIRFLNKPHEVTPEQTDSNTTIVTNVESEPNTTGGASEELQPQVFESPVEAPQPVFFAQSKTETETQKEPEPESKSEQEPESESELEPEPELELEPEPTEHTYTPAPVIPAGQFRQKKQKTSRLMAMAYMSNSMADSRPANNLPIPSSTWKENNDINKPTDSPKIHHHQPIRFGLSLRYQLSDRWSLESGLSYTLLVSDIPSVVNDKIQVNEQRLKYIGIPINIGYHIWTGQKSALYVTAGGTTEKNLSGSDWQFSLNGSAGAEYKLSKRFSLYAEPGVSYYIPNNSGLSTIYQDRPFNFNLTVGLRFNLR